ncbi:MAG: thiol:disulfide interchange protein DsbA/DsbL [Burkholderiales bacterium]
MMRRLFLAFVGSVLVTTAFATTKAPVVKEGIDYTVLSTSLRASSAPKGKVNVKEFFSFTCIHCKDVDPLVEQILIPNKKIDLKKIQVVWEDGQAIDPNLATLAKLNATLQLLGLSKLYTPVFNAIFSQQNLTDTDALQKFLAQNGLTKEQTAKFMQTYNSFMVNTKVGEYKNLTTQYNITGTPTFIVADKYVVKPAQPARLVEVVQALVDKVK